MTIPPLKTPFRGHGVNHGQGVKTDNREAGKQSAAF